MRSSTVGYYCSRLMNATGPGNVTATTGVIAFWKSPRGTLLRIEILVLVAASVFLFLATFGSQRRRRTHWIIQKGVFAAHTLCFSLATYTLGSMQSSRVKDRLYPIWAVSLFVLHGCTDSITAYSLDDNKQFTSYMYQAALYYAYVGLLFFTIWQPAGLGTVLPVAFLFLITMCRFLRRIDAYHLASSSWNLNKMVADYMYDEHTKGEFVPATMKGCHYLVDWPLTKSKLDAPSSYATKLTADPNEVIDIEKIWQCKDRSIDPEVKDACLSFSLFHLLRRRIFGFACGESKERAHDFVFKGLLLDNEGATDYIRVFKVIEVELAFMYDFFFTKHAASYYASRAATIWSLASITCISLTAYVAFYRLELIPCVLDESIVLNIIIDVVITSVILASAALLELLQLLLYWMTIWGRVSFVCQYLREKAVLNRRGSSCMMRLKELLTKIGVCCTSNKHHWQHKLGQYSLLGSVSDNSLSEKRHKLVSKLTEFDFLLERILGYLRRGLVHPVRDEALEVSAKTEKPTNLPQEVKKALVNTLIRTDGKLTNGESSLKFNEADHLLWACSRSWSQIRKENQTHIILIWHIATCYCEMATPKYLCPDEGTELKFHLDVATKLSKYCAYLVVCAPRLLPGHRYDTYRVFEAAAGEAKKFMRSSRDKYEAMRNLPESTETIFQSGAKLGKQLEEIQDVACRWKVMADFWSEMMLYLSPSDNVNDHIEQLAEGGEFITHLWALLSHAGILEREDRQVGDV